MTNEHTTVDDVSTSTINVEFHELATASKELSDIANEMHTLANKMNDCILEMRNLWQDENGKKFVDRFEEEVNSKFQRYYGTVQEYSDFIKGAHDAYLEHYEATQAAVEGAGTEG